MEAFKFLFQLTVGATFFLSGVERKKYFWPRLAGAFLVSVLLCHLNDKVLLTAPDMVHAILQYLVAFMLVVWVLKSVFEVAWREALFVASSGYALQNAAHYLFIILYVQIRAQGLTWSIDWIELVANAVIYLPAFLVSRRLPKRSTSMVAMDNIIAVSLMVLFFTIVLSSNVPLGGKEYLLYYVYSLFSALMVLFLQYGICEKTHLMYERDLIRKMLYLESKQHRLSEDTVNQINLKCHDLKHQLHTIFQREQLSTAAMEELKHMVQVYDSTFQTGNPAVDVILTEKALHCEKEQIEFSCILDGTQFNFMRPEDIYALFGNALDNAIESVEKEEPEHRFVALRSGRQGELLCLHLDNYCSGELKFVDGLPVTTKQQEPGFHGFGTKSIRFLAEKYGGFAQMRQEGTQVILDVFFPVAENCTQ